MINKRENPIDVFLEWFDEASRMDLPKADAVCLASATLDGTPSARIVLYKGIVDGGFSFYTNYDSKKGQDLKANPRAAMVFYWEPLGKQVRVEGAVKMLSSEQSDAYWYSRPFESQMSGSISPQSKTISKHEDLVAKSKEATAKYKSAGKVPRPGFWGGFTLIPSKVEFWINQDHRLHRRFLYEKSGDQWQVRELAP